MKLKLITLSILCHIISNNLLAAAAPDDRASSFAAIQAIHALAATAAAEAAAKHDVRVLTLGKEGEPDPNPMYHQTKSGLFLTTDGSPNTLFTEWGAVKIYGSISYGSGHLDGDVLFNQFRKHLTLKFVRNICEKGDRGGVLYRGDVIRFFKETCDFPIAETELEQYRGTDTLIKTNYCGAVSIYEITAIDGKPLPTPRIAKRSECRGYEECETDWASRMERYEKESADRK